MGDTEIPTSNLRDLQSAVTKVRAELRQLPESGSMCNEHIEKALGKVSLMQVPASARVRDTTQQNIEKEQK